MVSIRSKVVEKCCKYCRTQSIPNLRFHSSRQLSSSRPSVSWLDLQGSGLSAIERLVLEEALLRHDPLKRSWAIVGTHEPTYNGRLQIQSPNHVSSSQKSDLNKSCVIIMGIGGKPERLLDVERVKKDGVLVIKRFTGGGTVVIDHSSLWTTFIGRTHHFPHVEPFPRSIMEWSARDIFDNAFSNMTKIVSQSEKPRSRSLVVDTKSCGLSQDSGKTVRLQSNNAHMDQNVDSIPHFQLRENDYVMGAHKMGGNAQSIVNGAWLHHTSFLWDYDTENMQYLTLPDKRPEYRGDRSHDNFLVKLNKYYGIVGRNGIKLFFEQVKKATSEKYDLKQVTLNEAISIVDSELGGMQSWFDGKCRTKLIDL